jgi:hypothetical protein
VPLAVKEADTVLERLVLGVPLAEGLGVVLCEALTELLAEIDDEGDRLGVSDADTELLADSDAVATAVKLTLCVLLAVRLEDELCVALSELLTELEGELDKLGVFEVDAEPLGDCDAVTSAVELPLGVLLPVRLNVELCEAVTVLLTLVEGVTLGEAVAAALADQDADELAVRLVEGVTVTMALTDVEGVKLGELLGVASAALAVVEPLTEGVTVTTALTDQDTLVLGDALSEDTDELAVGLPVRVRLSETETEALAVSVAPPLAAPLAAGEGVGDSGQGGGAQTEIVRTRLLLPSTVISCPCGERARPPGPQMPAAAPTPSAYPCTAPPPASVVTPPVVVHTARMLPPFCTYRLPDAASMTRPCALL